MQEYQQENQSSVFDDGELEVQERSSILKLSGNVRIFAILTLVNAVIGLLAYIIHIGKPPVVVAEGFSGAILNSGNSIISTLISFGISALFFYFLYKFATHSKNAIEKLDQSELVTGFNNLGNYFKVIGAILILLVLIFVLMFVFFGFGRLVA